MMQPDFGLLCATSVKEMALVHVPKDFRATYPRRAPQYQPNAAQDDDTDKHEAELPRK